jgi:hypothetical protein
VAKDLTIHLVQELDDVLDHALAKGPANPPPLGRPRPEGAEIPGVRVE